MSELCQPIKGCHTMNAPGRVQNPGRRASQYTRPARLLLVDDQRLVRTRVRQILREFHQVTIVGEAVNGREAVTAALTLRPDIILMDISMPELSGIDATNQITAQLPNVYILGFSADSDEVTVRSMLAAGACGFVSKDGDPSELILALRKILTGESFVGVYVNHAPMWPRRD